MAQNNGGGLAIAAGVVAFGGFIAWATSRSTPQPAPPVRPRRTDWFDATAASDYVKFIRMLTNNCEDPPRRRYEFEQIARNSPMGFIRWATRHVHSRVTWVSDRATWGRPDHWQTPAETMYLGTGDCEDQAILLYRWLVEAGFQHIDFVSGRTGNSGHAWVELPLGANRVLLEATSGEVFLNRPAEYIPGTWINTTGYRFSESGTVFNPLRQRTRLHS